MSEDKKESLREKEARYHLYGWSLFIACALLFIAASVIDREPLTLAGSIIFLLACLFFLIPLLNSFKKGKGEG